MAGCCTLMQGRQAERTACIAARCGGLLEQGFGTTMQPRLICAGSLRFGNHHLTLQRKRDRCLAQRDRKAPESCPFYPMRARDRAF